jgi:hypothetical protein
VKLTNFHILVSSLAAIAGVALAAYQTFLVHPAVQPPVNVVVTVDPQKSDSAATGETVAKSNPPPLLTEAANLAQDATFGAALKDGSEARYSFASLFDGADDTFLAITPPDEELNILVMFKDGRQHEVTALEYIPPAGVDPAAMATTLDIMVLPEGRLEASGRPVISFTLPQSAETRTYAIPGREQGKGLWLRVAGKPGTGKSYVGDFRVLSEYVAP